MIEKDMALIKGALYSTLNSLFLLILKGDSKIKKSSELLIIPQYHAEDGKKDLQGDRCRKYRVDINLPNCSQSSVTKNHCVGEGFNCSGCFLTSTVTSVHFI